MTIGNDDIEIIEKYKHSSTARTLKLFAVDVVRSSVRWMERMINGPEMFDIETMDDWEYNSEKKQLKLKRPSRSSDGAVIFDTSFTQGTLEEYNQGLSSILSSFWYKTYAVPTALVELIACCDLLYRKYHNNMSPANAARVPYNGIKPLS